MTNAKVKRKNLLWKFRLHSAFIPLPHTLLSPSRSHSCDSPLPAPAFLLRRGMLLFLADLFLRCSRILFELDDDVCFVIVWPASAQQKTKEKRNRFRVAECVLLSKDGDEEEERCLHDGKNVYTLPPVVWRQLNARVSFSPIYWFLPRTELRLELRFCSCLSGASCYVWERFWSGRTYAEALVLPVFGNSTRLSLQLLHTALANVQLRSPNEGRRLLRAYFIHTLLLGDSTKMTCYGRRCSKFHVWLQWSHSPDWQTPALCSGALVKFPRLRSMSILD